MMLLLHLQKQTLDPYRTGEGSLHKKQQSCLLYDDSHMAVSSHTFSGFMSAREACQKAWEWMTFLFLKQLFQTKLYLHSKTRKRKVLWPSSCALQVSVPVQRYSNDSLGLLNSLPTVLDMPPFCYIINSRSGGNCQSLSELVDTPKTIGKVSSSKPCVLLPQDRTHPSYFNNNSS